MHSLSRRTQTFSAKAVRSGSPSTATGHSWPFSLGSLVLTKSGRALGLQAVLYCGTCEAIVTFEKAAIGPVKDWPYCPLHQERPLMVRAVSALRNVQNII
jgi:hypothetical protein